MAPTPPETQRPTISSKNIPKQNALLNCEMNVEARQESKQIAQDFRSDSDPLASRCCDC